MLLIVFASILCAGIFALVLEANHKLTWRDLQHLIVKTSKVVTKDDPDWQYNGAGHRVSAKYGFGALDTDGLVKMASSKSWKSAQPQHTCTDASNVKMKLNDVTKTSIVSTGCANLINCVTKLEHVHVIITLQKSKQRGQLEITLISPAGTRSPILKQRSRDTSAEGFQNWAFLTVFHWDENPSGKWNLEIIDHSSPRHGDTLVKWQLKFYGTCDMKSMFDLTINETEICDKDCKRDCPKIFSEVCMGCSQYCDCTVGQCVADCDDHLVTDNQLRHCKRSMDYAPRVNSKNGKVSRTKPVMGISLSAKFAIICLSLLVISAMIAGIAYFAAKMPNGKELPKGYHSVSRYPCSDVVVEGGEEQIINNVDENIVKS